jgi:hypothetical protein
MRCRKTELSTERRTQVDAGLGNGTPGVIVQLVDFVARLDIVVGITRVAVVVALRTYGRLVHLVSAHPPPQPDVRHDRASRR